MLDFFIFLALLINISLNIILYNHTSKERNLFFVFSTFRHGARLTFFSNDIFGNNISNPGKLTKYGEYQHLILGKNNRKRYKNFINLSYDPEEIYIRTSDVERTIISTNNQLLGLFEKQINYTKTIIENGINFWELYQINETDKKELSQALSKCKRRLLSLDELEQNATQILENCFGIKMPNDRNYGLCDQVFSSYYEYKYNNDSNNKLFKCGFNNAKILYDYCISYFDSYRGWDENAAYMFTKFFKRIFDWMEDSINNKTKLKMAMIGGHDITIDKMMDYLDGLNIIKREEYPYYGFNLLMELRKYNRTFNITSNDSIYDNFYVEIYYDDKLKYNKTYNELKRTIMNSRYSNLKNLESKCIIEKIKKNLKNDLIVVFLLILVLMISIILILYIKKIKKSNYYPIKKTKLKKSEITYLYYNKNSSNS